MRWPWQKKPPVSVDKIGPDEPRVFIKGFVQQFYVDKDQLFMHMNFGDGGYARIPVPKELAAIVPVGCNVRMQLIKE